MPGVTTEPEVTWGVGLEHEVVPVFLHRPVRREGGGGAQAYPALEAVPLTRIWRELNATIVQPSLARQGVPLYPMDIDTDEAGRPCLELITRFWKRRTLGQYVDDLVTTRRMLLPDLQKLTERRFPGRPIRWPEQGADILLSEHDSQRVDEPAYLGSYHVNLTLPHPAGLSSRALLARHTKAAMALQWLEPLLMACLACPSPYSVLDHRHFSQLSVRHSSEPLALALARDILRDGFPDDRHSNEDAPAPHATFNSFDPKQLAAAVAALKRNLQRHIERYPRWLKLLMRNSAHSPQALSHFARANRNRLEDGLLGRPLGTDFRRDSEKGPRYGFEFRLLDYFPPEATAEGGLLDVLRLLLYACDGSAAWPASHSDLLPFDAMACDSVHQQYLQCILEGWNAQALPGYVRALQRAFGVTQQGKVCQDVMHSLAAQLFARHGGGRGTYSRHLDRDGTGRLCERAPAIPEVNRRSWEAFLQRRFPAVARRVAGLKREVQVDDVLGFLGHSRPTQEQRAAVEEDMEELRAYQASGRRDV